MQDEVDPDVKQSTLEPKKESNLKLKNLKSLSPNQYISIKNNNTFIKSKAESLVSEVNHTSLTERIPSPLGPNPCSILSDKSMLLS